MSIPNDSRKSDVSGQVPEQHYRYFVVPCCISDLVETKVITRGEAWLLGIIDSFVKYKGNGCWASNELLATKCGVKVRQIQYDLEKLMELGLISLAPIQVMQHGQERRTLVTKFTSQLITLKNDA